MKQKSNKCLIDYLRFSIPNTTFFNVANNILGIDYSKFSSSDLKGSPYPTYDFSVSFSNIKLHSSKTHDNILVDISGQACRQYEEYMCRLEGWHWQKFIHSILSLNGIITRIDLALDIFDNSTPSLKSLEEYISRGQLCTKSYKYMKINSGRILDGQVTGRSLYIGASPQILRIYDKKQERKDNADEFLFNIDKWVRWELELTHKKAMIVATHISSGKPLNSIIKGILSSHYAFKIRPKNNSDFHNKNRLANMRWWDNFIRDIESIPLNVYREKSTLNKKKKWIEHSASKSIGMIYEVYREAYSKEYAKLYISELVEKGINKITDIDKGLISQRVLELTSEIEY